jgi:hypothetical protein
MTSLSVTVLDALAAGAASCKGAAQELFHGLRHSTSGAGNDLDAVLLEKA